MKIRVGMARRRCGTAAFAMTLVVALLGPVAVSGHPGSEHETAGLGMQVNAPAELAGFREVTPWGSVAVDGETADLVYAGTGCTLANYAGLDVAGKIALVDDAQGANPADTCGPYLFQQKMTAAEEAGAIALVQVSRDETTTAGSVLVGEIPGMEMVNSLGVPVRDAVVAGTTVNVTLVDKGRLDLPRTTDLPCVNGHAGPFDCDGVDLMAYVPAEDFNGAGQSDLWGWTDPETGEEYVIIGKTNGIAFFRVTEATDPVYLGELPNPGLLHAVWHDMKVYADHVFTVSESEGHGMTVFDLTRLRDATEPRTWTTDAHYRLVDAAHNIAINEETGFAYVVGGNSGLVVPDHCMSGLHMVDIRDPKAPLFAGCYAVDGGPGTAARVVGEPAVMDNSPAAYVHDTQCVVYRGPDTRYTGRELCFNAAEDKVVIADVTDKLSPVTVGQTSYPLVAYSHQGWLTEDHRYLLVNDELDVTTHDINSRTVVLDVTDLRNPTVHVEYLHQTKTITHNNYTLDGVVYQSNYTSGVRVLDTRPLDDAADPRLEQVGFFDTYPGHDMATFQGTWSNYPYFPSGTIAASGMEEGLFLLRLNDDARNRLNPAERSVELACTDCPVEVRAGEDGSATLRLSNTGNVSDRYDLTVEGLPEGWTATLEPASATVPGGGNADVVLTVTTPPNARADTYALVVTAVSTEDPAVSATTEVPVEVRKGRPSTIGPPF